MAEEHVTETDTAGNTHTTTIIRERRGGGGLLIGLAVLILVLVGAYFLIKRSNDQNRQSDAIVGAAASVKHAADKAGDAIKSPNGN